MSEIKECPFCGSPAKLEELGDHHGEFFNLGCSDEKCPAHNMFYTWAEDEGPVEMALELWNTRAPQPAAGPWNYDKPTEDDRYLVLWDQDEYGTAYWISDRNAWFYHTAIKGTFAMYERQPVAWAEIKLPEVKL